VGFEPTTAAGEWPQTYALDCAATGTGRIPYEFKLFLALCIVSPFLPVLIRSGFLLDSSYVANWQLSLMEMVQFIIIS
jgi:hypothetical protein